MRGDIAPEECIETLRLYEKKWDLQHVAPQLEIYPVDLVTAETYTFTHTQMPEAIRARRKPTRR